MRTSPLTRARPRPSAPTPHLHSYTSLQSHRYRCWFMSLVGTGRCSFCSPSGRVPSPPRGAATRRPRPPRLPRQAARPRRSRQSIARRKAAPRGKGGGGAEGARSSSTTLSLSLSLARARLRCSPCTMPCFIIYYHNLLFYIFIFIPPRWDMCVFVLR